MGPPSILLKSLTDENENGYISQEEHRAQWMKTGKSMLESIGIRLDGTCFSPPSVHFEYALGESGPLLDDTLMGCRLIMIMPWKSQALHKPLLLEIAIAPWEVPVLTDSITTCRTVITALSGLEITDLKTGDKAVLPQTITLEADDEIRYNVKITAPDATAHGPEPKAGTKEFAPEYLLVLDTPPTKEPATP